jgi:hypothetical protein
MRYKNVFFGVTFAGSVSALLAAQPSGHALHSKLITCRTESVHPHQLRRCTRRLHPAERLSSESLL